MAYQGRTLTELAKELERQSKEKKDFLAPTNLLELSVRQQAIEPVVNFTVGDKFAGEMTDHMHNQVGKYTGIPGNYYDRMLADHPELLAVNVNTWMKDQKEIRLVRTLDGRARAFLSNRYRTIDNYDVANAALPVLLGESGKLSSIETVSSEVTDKRLYIKVVSKRLTFEVKKGDAVQMGIVISNSEVGKGSVRVEPFLYRLICLNGAIMEDAAIRKFHLGRQSAELEAAEQVFRDETRQADDRAFMMKLQDVVRAAFNDDNFQRLKGMTIDASTRKIRAPIQDVVEEISSTYKLSDKYKDSFLRNLIEGTDITQWGLVNAMTAVANEADSYEDATEIEQIGGNLLAMPAEGFKRLAQLAA